MDEQEFISNETERLLQKFGCSTLEEVKEKLRQIILEKHKE